jgi:hypothetical protein
MNTDGDTTLLFIVKLLAAVTPAQSLTPVFASTSPAERWKTPTTPGGGKGGTRGPGGIVPGILALSTMAFGWLWSMETSGKSVVTVTTLLGSGLSTKEIENAVAGAAHINSSAETIHPTRGSKLMECLPLGIGLVSPVRTPTECER